VVTSKKVKLSNRQAEALQNGKWLTYGARAVGKSYTAAILIIEAAKAGKEPHMIDISTLLERGHSIPEDIRFADRVMSIAKEMYPDDVFSYKPLTRRLTYLGTRFATCPCRKEVA
jgi:hypothetical protein